MPPASSLRSGPSFSVILSPGLNVRLLQPERVRTPGLDISIDHILRAVPLASTTFGYECGLTQRNSTTTPLKSGSAASALQSAGFGCA